MAQLRLILPSWDELIQAGHPVRVVNRPDFRTINGFRGEKMKWVICDKLIGDRGTKGLPVPVLLQAHGSYPNW
jgi:hypothetical protein